MSQPDNNCDTADEEKREKETIEGYHQYYYKLSNAQNFLLLSNSDQSLDTKFSASQQHRYEEDYASAQYDHDNEQKEEPSITDQPDGTKLPEAYEYCHSELCACVNNGDGNCYQEQSAGSQSDHEQGEKHGLDITDHLHKIKSSELQQLCHHENSANDQNDHDHDQKNGPSITDHSHETKLPVAYEYCHRKYCSCGHKSNDYDQKHGPCIKDHSYDIKFPLEYEHCKCEYYALGNIGHDSEQERRPSITDHSRDNKFPVSYSCRHHEHWTRREHN